MAYLKQTCSNCAQRTAAAAGQFVRARLLIALALAQPTLALADGALHRRTPPPPPPPQRNALSYFNFLNEEGRIVVGALLPVNRGAGGEDAAAAAAGGGGQQR